VHPYNATLPSFGENTQGPNNDGTVQLADNNSNYHYFSQSKATLAQIAVKYFASDYLQSCNNQIISKICYCPILQVSLNAKCLWRILKNLLQWGVSRRRSVKYQKSRTFINTAARTSNLAFSRKRVGVGVWSEVSFKDYVQNFFIRYGPAYKKIFCAIWLSIRQCWTELWSLPRPAQGLNTNNNNKAVRIPNQDSAKNCGTNAQKFWNFYQLRKIPNIPQKTGKKFQFFWHTY